MPIFAPRLWQVDCLDKLNNAFSVQRDFLVVATPGGGKTRLGLQFAKRLIERGVITHVHVVTPTSALRIQWNSVSAEFGIPLVRKRNNDLRNFEFPIDVIGVAATYQQVAYCSDAHAANIENSNDKSLVIFDECHHVGDKLAWGDAMRSAFERARFRLHLSGTPFRNDGNVIPWISFDQSGVAVASEPYGYTYSYLQAMEDDVCRPVAFKYRNINMVYFAKNRPWDVDFTDELDESGESLRLRQALSVSSGLVEDMVRHADQSLSEIRSRGGRFVDAAGILVAMNQQHAEECAKVVEEVTGETPALIISDSDSADEELKAFSGAMKRWVVSVKMVSEGVDIPRLMVGVYATNVVSTLFFRQFVGRVVRVRHRGLHEMALIYMPADERLKYMASEILSEVKQFIKDRELDYPELKKALATPRRHEQLVLRASRLLDGGIIIGGYQFTADEIEEASRYRKISPEHDRYSNEQVALRLAVLRDEEGLNFGYSGGRRVAPREAA